MHASFAEAEPSPFVTADAAAENLAVENSGLEGLDLDNGQISFRGERVGTYEIIDQPEGTFAVESAEWCYADPNDLTPDPASLLDDAIGAAAATRLFEDNSFSGQSVFDHVNIVDNFGVDNDAFVIPDSANLISTSTRSAIEAALDPVTVTWISDSNEVIVDERTDADAVGAVLSIAAPVLEGNAATVTTNLWCAGMCGIGGARTLTRSRWMDRHRARRPRMAVLTDHSGTTSTLRREHLTTCDVGPNVMPLHSIP